MPLWLAANTVSKCIKNPSIHAREYSWLPSLDIINRIDIVTSVYLVRITGLACLQKNKVAARTLWRAWKDYTDEADRNRLDIYGYQIKTTIEHSSGM